MDNYIEYIKARLKNLDDIYYRKMKVCQDSIWLVYNESLVDSNLVSNYVVRSLVEIIQNEDFDVKSLKEKIEVKLGRNKENIENSIAINKIKKIEKTDAAVFTYILSGFVMIYINGDVYVVEARGNLYRSISEPVNENSIRGSKDSFVESIVKNIGLIRNRIKSEELVYSERLIGTKTKTNVGMMYIQNVVKLDLVDYVEKRLNDIVIDEY